MSSNILKSVFTVSAMTLISRITGLVRDVILANVLGAGMAADAFFVAFRIPNLFRRIFAEGAFSLAFVPVFSEYYSARSQAEMQAFVNQMAVRLILSLLVVGCVGVFFCRANHWLDRPRL